MEASLEEPGNEISDNGVLSKPTGIIKVSGLVPTPATTTAIPEHLSLTAHAVSAPAVSGVEIQVPDSARDILKTPSQNSGVGQIGKSGTPAKRALKIQVVDGGTSCSISKTKGGKVCSYYLS